MMEITTVINIGQYVLSVLVIPALWFVVKLWNRVSLLDKFKEDAEKKAEKEEQRLEEKESKREEWERMMYKEIIEMSKDIHYVKQQINQN